MAHWNCGVETAVPFYRSRCYCSFTTVAVHSGTLFCFIVRTISFRRRRARRLLYVQYQSSRAKLHYATAETNERTSDDGGHDLAGGDAELSKGLVSEAVAQRRTFFRRRRRSVPFVGFVSFVHLVMFSSHRADCCKQLEGFSKVYTTLKRDNQSNTLQTLLRITFKSSDKPPPIAAVWRSHGDNEPRDEGGLLQYLRYIRRGSEI